MYIAILDYKLATLGIALATLFFLSVGIHRRYLGMRAMLFAYAPSFAAAFYVLALLLGAPTNAFDLFACALFEFLVLRIYLSLLVNLLDYVPSLNPQVVRRMLVASLALQLAAAWPLLTTGGFGVFSEGSRIAYLYESSSAKYLTYAQVIAVTIQIGLVANKINARGNIGLLSVLVVLVNFGLSLASGSKGAVFLWMASIVALVNLRALRARPFIAVGAITLALVGVLTTAYFVGQFLNITMLEFANLVFGRFFLVNDARALAIDLRGTTDSLAFFPEAFRSVGNLVGIPPRNPNLGSYLYDEYFGPSGGSGANASLTALMISYSAPGLVFLPALLFSTCLMVASMVIREFREKIKSKAGKYVLTILSMNLLLSLSQDFLAFQVLLPLTLLIAPALIYVSGGLLREFRKSRRQFAEL